MKPETVYIVRAVACGCVIGGCLENGFGEPLTKREAHKLAEYENERSARRREQKLPGAYDYYVDSFIHSSPASPVASGLQYSQGVGESNSKQ